MNQEANNDSLLEQFTWMRKRIQGLLSYSHEELQPLPEPKEDTDYSYFVTQNRFNDHDRVFLNIALASVIQPTVLDPLFKHQAILGGIYLKEYQQYYPTIRTGLMLLAGHDNQKYMDYSRIYKKGNRLFNGDILTVIKPKDHGLFADYMIELQQIQLSFIAGVAIREHTLAVEAK
jgi:hypothetical protein